MCRNHPQRSQTPLKVCIICPIGRVINIPREILMPAVSHFRNTTHPSVKHLTKILRGKSNIKVFQDTNHIYLYFCATIPFLGKFYMGLCVFADVSFDQTYYFLMIFWAPKENQISTFTVQTKLKYCYGYLQCVWCAMYAEKKCRWFNYEINLFPKKNYM